jgi:hypothetical protein
MDQNANKHSIVEADVKVLKHLAHLINSAESFCSVSEHPSGESALQNKKLQVKSRTGAVALHLRHPGGWMDQARAQSLPPPHQMVSEESGVGANGRRTHR